MGLLSGAKRDDASAHGKEKKRAKTENGEDHHLPRGHKLDHSHHEDEEPRKDRHPKAHLKRLSSDARFKSFREEYEKLIEDEFDEETDEASLEKAKRVYEEEFGYNPSEKITLENKHRFCLGITRELMLLMRNESVWELADGPDETPFGGRSWIERPGLHFDGVLHHAKRTDDELDCFRMRVQFPIWLPNNEKGAERIARALVEFNREDRREWDQSYDFGGPVYMYSPTSFLFYGCWLPTSITAKMCMMNERDFCFYVSRKHVDVAGGVEVVAFRSVLSDDSFTNQAVEEGHFATSGFVIRPPQPEEEYFDVRFTLQIDLGGVAPHVVSDTIVRDAIYDFIAGIQNNLSEGLLDRKIRGNYHPDSPASSVWGTMVMSPAVEKKVMTKELDDPPALPKTKAAIEAERRAKEEEEQRAREEEEARKAAEEQEARREAEEEARKAAEEQEEEARKAAEEQEEEERKAAEEQEEEARKAAEEREEEARKAAEEREEEARKAAEEREEEERKAAEEREEEERKAAEEREEEERKAAEEETPDAATLQRGVSFAEDAKEEDGDGEDDGELTDDEPDISIPNADELRVNKPEWAKGTPNVLLASRLLLKIAKARSFKVSAPKDLPVSREELSEDIRKTVEKILAKLDEIMFVEMMEEWLSWSQDPKVMRQRWNQNMDNFKFIRSKADRRRENLQRLLDAVENADEGLLKALDALGIELEDADEEMESKEAHELTNGIVLEVKHLQEEEQRKKAEAGRAAMLSKGKKMKSMTSSKAIIEIEKEKIDQGNQDAMTFVLTNDTASHRYLRLQVVYRLFEENIVKQAQLFDVLRKTYTDVAFAKAETAPSDVAKMALLDSIARLVGKKLDKFSVKEDLSAMWKMLFVCEVNPQIEDVEGKDDAAVLDEHFNTVFMGSMGPVPADLFTKKYNSFVTSPNTTADLQFGELRTPTFNQMIKLVQEHPQSYGRAMLPHLIKAVLYYATLYKHQEIAGAKFEASKAMAELVQATCMEVLKSNASPLKDDEVRGLRKALLAAVYIMGNQFGEEQLRTLLSVAPAKAAKNKKLTLPYFQDAAFKYNPKTFKDKMINRIFDYGTHVINVVAGEAKLSSAPNLKKSITSITAEMLEGIEDESEEGQQDPSAPGAPSGESGEAAKPGEGEKAAADAKGAETAAAEEEGDEEDMDIEEIYEIFIPLVRELVSPDLFLKIFLERGEDVVNHYSAIIVPTLLANGIPVKKTTMQSLWIEYVIDEIYSYMLETRHGLSDAEVQQEKMRELNRFAYTEKNEVIPKVHQVMLQMILFIMKQEYDLKITFFPFQTKLFGLFCHGALRPSTYAKEQVTAGGGKSTVALAIKTFFVTYRSDALFTNYSGVLYVSNMPPEEFGDSLLEYLDQLGGLVNAVKKQSFLDDKTLSALVGCNPKSINKYASEFMSKEGGADDKKKKKAGTPKKRFLAYALDRANEDAAPLFRGGVHATFDELERVAYTEKYAKLLGAVRFCMIVDESDYGPLPEKFHSFPKIGMSATSIWRESVTMIQALYKSQMRLMGGKHQYPEAWLVFREIVKELTKYAELIESAREQDGSALRDQIFKYRDFFETKVDYIESDEFKSLISAIQEPVNGVSPSLIRKWSYDLLAIMVKYMRELSESIEILDVKPDANNHVQLDGTTEFQDDVDHFLQTFLSHPESELKNTHTSLLMMPDYPTFEDEDSVHNFIKEHLFTSKHAGLAKEVVILAQTKMMGKYEVHCDFQEKSIGESKVWDERTIEGRVICLYSVDSRGGDFKMNSNVQRVVVRAAIFETLPGAVTFYQTLRRLRQLKPGMKPRQGLPLRTHVYCREKSDDLLMDALISQYENETTDFKDYIKREFMRTRQAVRVSSREIIKKLRTEKYSKVNGAGYLQKSAKKDPVTKKPEETAFERIFKTFVGEMIELYVSKIKRINYASVAEFKSLWDSFFKKKSDLEKLWVDTVSKDFSGKFARTATVYHAFYKCIATEMKKSKNMQAKFFDLFYFTSFKT